MGQVRPGLKRVAKGAGNALSVLARPLARAESRPVVVFNFHRIADVASSAEADAWNVPPATFERQIRFLSEYAEVVPLAGVREDVHRTTGPPRCAITFDDGYACVVNVALPILEKYSVCATMFLVTELIGLDRPMPFDRWSQSTDESLLWATRPVTTREVNKALDSGLVEVGSHSAQHRDGRFLDRDQMLREAHSSRRALHDEFGIEATMYAYPYGSIRRGSANRLYREAVQEAGFAMAFTTETAVVTPQLDPFMLPRIEVTADDTPRTLRAKLEGSLVGQRVVDRLARK